MEDSKISVSHGSMKQYRGRSCNRKSEELKSSYPISILKANFCEKHFNFETNSPPNFLTHGSLDSLPSNSSDDEGWSVENLSSSSAQDNNVFDRIDYFKFCDDTTSLPDINNNIRKNICFQKENNQGRIIDENYFKKGDREKSKDLNDDIAIFCEIFCYGPLLLAAQNANIHKDSKSFVDSKMKNDSGVILLEYDVVLNETGDHPSDEQVEKFVKSHFLSPGSLEKNASLELDSWTPNDWKEAPKFLAQISDGNLRSWASHLNNLWTKLGCKIKDDVKDNNERFSMIYSKNPIIIPGGRFREFYYWDNYWIIRGLLLSEMYTTVKGSIRNFLDLVNEFGFVPNGGRIYYTGRSQPPFLTLMVREYVDKTGDTAFRDEALPILEREHEFWMKKRNVSVTDKQGNLHILNRYASDTNQPRPESFREDSDLTTGLDEAAGQELMTHITSACESGWDFSSRWTGTCFQNGDNVRRNLRTRDIIPVDLNSILAAVEQTLADFYLKSGNTAKSDKFTSSYNARVEAIESILWNEEDGVYYDYIISQKSHNRQYYASNVNPLWTKCYATSVNIQEREQRLYNYLTSSNNEEGVSVLQFPGGIPTSLHNSGEQWDFPNAWPPLVHMIIEGLATSNLNELREEGLKQAQKWITSNWRGYNQSVEHWMFEKYDVTREDGKPGEGGEYDVQAGFGWTNGVVMSFLERYGNVLTAEPMTDLATTIMNPVTTTSGASERSTIATVLAASMAVSSYANSF